MTADPMVSYDLVESGPPLFASWFVTCWFCGEPAHGWPPKGNSCPVRHR